MLARNRLDDKGIEAVLGAALFYAALTRTGVPLAGDPIELLLPLAAAWSVAGTTARGGDT